MSLWLGSSSVHVKMNPALYVHGPRYADPQSGILKQSAHPVALLMLYLFRSAAIAVYVLCGLCESYCKPR